MSEKRSLVRRFFALFRLKRVLIGVCVVVALHTLLNIWAYLVLQRELEKARAAGIELRLFTYNNMPWNQNEANAAPFYRAAFELLRLPRDEQEKVRDYVERAWPSQGLPGADVREKMSSFLTSERVARALELIQDANQVPQCFWIPHYGEGYNTLLPHLAKLRQAARAILIRARLRYVAGDPDGASGDIRSVLRLAERLESDRVVISELVQCALADLCVDGLRQMATAAPMSADIAQDMSNSLNEFEGLLDITESLRLETAMAYDWSERMRGNPGLAREWAGQLTGPDSSQLSFLPYFVTCPFRPLYRLEQTRLLRYFRELTELSQKPCHTVKDRLNEMEADLNQRSQAFNLTGWIAGGMTKAYFGVAKARAQVRAARLGLALEACQDRTGSYPESIEALVPDILPELPVDPFSGKDLLYRLTDEELVVYSVGKNGVDDGGLKEEVGERGVLLNPGADDIAWRVPRQDLASD